MNPETLDMVARGIVTAVFLIVAALICAALLLLLLSEVFKR